MLADLLGGLGGMIGAEQGKVQLNQGYSQANVLLSGLNEEIARLPIPDTEKMKLYLEMPKLVGQLTPEEINTFVQGSTAIENVKVDPTLRKAQMDALSQIEKAAGGGLREEDLAAMRQARREVEADEQSRQAALLNEMAQRGRAGGGSELALRAMSAQQAASRQAQSNDAQLIAARQAALQAASQAASLGGNIRQQDYGEQMDRARAIDEINKFNVTNRQNVAGQNVANRNAAQSANLQAAQRIADAGVDLRNKQQQYNKELQQQAFQNQLAKLQARGGVNTAQANLAVDKGKADFGYASGQGRAIGGLLGSGAQFAFTPKPQGGLGVGS